jgi:hypothetical protein
MPVYTQEEKIILAIDAIASQKAAGKKLSIPRAAKTFEVPYTSLYDRMHNRPRREPTQPNRHKLDPIEERTLLRYVLEQDARGFPLQPSSVEYMANLLIKSHGGKPVGKHWARRFVDAQPTLKTKFNCPYDYQRALQEDPEVISKWFALLHNMMAKYGIQEEDLYNFDETGFMMGMITASMVVTHADRRGKAKSVQPGNREWATVIECINSKGWCLPPFVIVQGQYHLANWTTESGFPKDWVIKPTPNGWTNNETGLDWIKHFDKHTKGCTKDVYRMLIIDGHESHLSAEFDEYCKDNKIMTISMPAHSSHLLQPLDVALYSPLKRAYGDKINLFIKASVKHITKCEFFVAFMAAHLRIFTEENIKSGFRGAGILPWNPDFVIEKLDVRLRTPTLSGSCPGTAAGWESQTPSNPQQTVSQSNFIKSRISAHQGSSPTPIIEAVDRLAKGAQAMAHSITLLTDQVHTLQDANIALAKRRRAKKSRVQLGGALSIEDSQAILAEKDKTKRPAVVDGENGGPSKKAATTARQCGVCGKTGHNARTCSKDVKLSNESDSD